MALFAIAGILILDNLGVNVTALVAGLGIGGIAIGLAAQGIFSDLFAALSILFDKPFKKGDVIRYDSSTGTVERIGLKTTRLRSLTGEQLIMANTKLLEREIHNMAQAKARRITLYMAVGGDTSAGAIDSVFAAAEAAVSAQKGCKFVRCALSGAGASALAFDLVYDDSSRDNDVLAANRSAILRALIEGLASKKLQLVRASDQPTAPLPSRQPPDRLAFPHPCIWDSQHPANDRGKLKFGRSCQAPGCACSQHLDRYTFAMPLATLTEIKNRVGEEVGVSSWILVDQARIDAFADATEDRQFIHVDPAAAAQTPFGGTIAHGFLSLSLLSRMAAEAMLVPEGLKMAVNYGLDRVRFLAPVRSGKRVRGRFTLDSVEEKAPGQWLLRHIVTVEIEGEDKPALTALWLALMFI